jgi:hypothetical protein
LPFGARRDFPVFERGRPFDPLMVEPEERVGPHVTKLERQVFRVAEPSEVEAGKEMPKKPQKTPFKAVREARNRQVMKNLANNRRVGLLTISSSL